MKKDFLKVLYAQSVHGQCEIDEIVKIRVICAFKHNEFRNYMDNKEIIIYLMNYMLLINLH